MDKELALAIKQLVVRLIVGLGLSFLILAAFSVWMTNYYEDKLMRQEVVVPEKENLHGYM